MRGLSCRPWPLPDLAGRLLARYWLGKRWTLKLGATNLAAAPEQQYAGTSRRDLNYGDTGRGDALGINLNC